jgi:hypothetical protein
MNGAKNVRGNGKNLPKSILWKKGTPSVPKKSAHKKSISNQGVASNDSARAKGRKKPKGHKVSFSGKKAGQPTSLRK